MGEIISSLVVVGLVVLVFVAFGKYAENHPSPPPTPRERLTIRCPNCGSPADVNDSWWECGWCGDSGRMKR